MALISDELWAATLRRAIELAKEHASAEERPRMERLHMLGIADEFDGKKGEFGIIKVKDA
jgi:hypothetical protein